MRVGKTELVISTLMGALHSEIPIGFSYRKGKGEERRYVAPYELLRARTTGNLILVGWDYEREAMRNFKVDRIRNINASARQWRAPLLSESSSC